MSIIDELDEVIVARVRLSDAQHAAAGCQTRRDWDAQHRAEADYQERYDALCVRLRKLAREQASCRAAYDGLVVRLRKLTEAP
jgi:hypothetical protein